MLMRSRTRQQVVQVGNPAPGRDVPRWRATSAVRCHTRLTKHSVPSLTEVVTLVVRCSVVLMVG